MTKDLICLKCSHLRLLSGGCDAFPKGIPYEMTNQGKNTHDEPMEGQDNEIVFKQLTNELEQYK